MTFAKPAIAALSLLGLSLAGCDSKAENEVEQTAEAIDESYEAEANLTEAVAQGGPSEVAAEAAADDLRAKGEETKDKLEDMADELDKAPQ